MQQGSHAVGLFAQSTTDKHYFRTDELQMGLVGQKESWMCLRSRQSNTTWTLSDECDTTFYFLHLL